MSKNFEKDKRLGLVLIVFGVLIVLFSSSIKILFFQYSSLFSSMLIWFVAGIITALGFMLRRSDEAQKMIEESRLKVNDEFKKAKKKEREKDEFVEFLSRFSKDEIEIIEQVHTYEGISKDSLVGQVVLSKSRFDKAFRRLINDKVISVHSECKTEKIYLNRIS